LPACVIPLYSSALFYMDLAGGASKRAQQPTDAELVAASLSGDSRSRELLLRRYERMIYSVPVRLSFDMDERREVFQTVCCRILENLHALADASKLQSWILTITIRECNHLIRSKYLQRRHDPEDSALDLPDPGADTLEIYLRSEREQFLREVFDELPERCRDLLRMLFLADTRAGYDDLAKHFGLSAETIGSLRHRCLDHLRRLLQSRNL
jgi:RNA polymerase sigma factor (sigma-70 family)